MLFDIAVWLMAMLLALPIVVFTTAAIKTRRFYRQHDVSVARKVPYLAALVFCSICGLSYVAFWIWRLCMWCDKPVPFMAALMLERFMFAALVCSLISIVCLAVGRGPHRVLLGFAIIFVAIWLWHGLPMVIHWA